MQRNPMLLTLALVGALWAMHAVPARGAAAPAPGSAAPRQAPQLGSVLASIDQIVTDADRAQRAKALVQRMAGEIRQSQAEARLRYFTLRQQALNYNATKEQLDRALDELNRGLADSAQRFVEARMQLKETLTAEEWRSLAERLLAHSGARQPVR